MRKTFYILSVLIFSLLSATAQLNLVSNPSFEDTVMCPNSGGQVSLAKFWYSIYNTPDYFHSCNPFAQFSVPYNTFGYQYPNTGNAYVGLCDYTTDVPEFREAIGAFLTAPLNIGQKYYVTLHLCLAYNPPKLDCNAATNKMGILFSTIDYLTSPPPINNFCQVYSDSIISDSINWSVVRGSFVADSAYTFISITNFFNNGNTDTIQLDTTTHIHHSYYYIDDICVSTDSIFTEIWTNLSNIINNNKIELYPNPVIDQFTINNIPTNCEVIEIYDMQGKKIKFISPDRMENISVNISLLEKGFYSIIFKSKKAIQIKKIIKIF